MIIGWASSCDIGPYHGWIMAYDARTLALVAVLNTTPDGNDGGIWQGDAGLAADRQGRIYAVTGNGTFSAGTSQHLDYGDTVLQLTLGAHGFVVSDYFTPGNEKTLEETDGDLGEVRHARRRQPRLALGLATCVAGQDAQVWSIEPR